MRRNSTEELFDKVMCFYRSVWKMILKMYSFGCWTITPVLKLLHKYDTKLWISYTSISRLMLIMCFWNQIGNWGHSSVWGECSSSLGFCHVSTKSILDWSVKMYLKKANRSFHINYWEWFTEHIEVELLELSDWLPCLELTQDWYYPMSEPQCSTLFVLSLL